MDNKEEQQEELQEAFAAFAAEYPHSALSLITGLFVGLLARDLVIKQIREALIEFQKVRDALNGYGLTTEKINVVIADALSIRPSTEALDAYVKQAVDAEREACAITCSMMQESIGGWRKATHDDCAAAIRARGAA